IAENHGETYLDKCRQFATNFMAFKKSAAKGLVTIPAFVEPAPSQGTAGSSRGTAMWATNVGNEHGQVLLSVLTEGEGEEIKDAGRHCVQVQECCGRQCVTKYFDAWPFLHVNLDTWHFIPRFPNGCTTDKHQLYGPFMARLSCCMFKIDEDDYARQLRAKREELLLQGVPNPSENDVIQPISPDEVSRHCKRLDTSGVPLIDSIKISDIWAKQSQHVACLQDPPVCRCARGSTSLENFHLHMARFIPGTLAKDTSFQVYLLDSIFRWNADRAAETVASNSQATVMPRTYSGPVKHQTNMLWQDLCGKPFFPNFKPHGKYT
ncbi:hypothetical protein MAR_004723, partial [Mya arenaria]